MLHFLGLQSVCVAFVLTCVRECHVLQSCNCSPTFALTFPYFFLTYCPFCNPLL